MAETCPFCGSTRLEENGMWLKQRETIFGRRCKSCKKCFQIRRPKGRWVETPKVGP